MCLSDVRRGQRVRVTCIEGEDLRTQLIRFGIGEGSRLECLERIPFGPSMIRHYRQELAIGRKHARRILVREDVV